LSGKKKSTVRYGPCFFSLFVAKPQFNSKNHLGRAGNKAYYLGYQQKISEGKVMNSDSRIIAENLGDVQEIEAHLREIQKRLAKAWIEGDREFIELVLADDWRVTDLTGRVLSKVEVLAEAFGSDERRVESMEITDLSVRPFGDWAIVTGRTAAAGEYRGERAEVALRFTDVFVNRDGRWQAVASQATLIQQ
jgi:ketosteroid isomerase-like protein